MSATHTSQCLSISDLLGRAACAIDGEDFSALIRRALRSAEECVEFDDCFIELRARVHSWLDEPPVAIAAGPVAFTFIDFVERFTPEDGFWYPVRDHDRYPDIGEWCCEDFERLRGIEQTMHDLVPGHPHSPAHAAHALLTRLQPHFTDVELHDA
jgi:hypothetical protein